MRPGDSLHTKCVYDTMSRNKTTFFGLATSDEMCYALLFVYPIERVTVKDCLSYLNISRCDRDDQTAVVDGCPIYGFIGSMELTQIIADVRLLYCSIQFGRVSVTVSYNSLVSKCCQRDISRPMWMKLGTVCTWEDTSNWLTFGVCWSMSEVTDWLRPFSL